MPDLFDFFKEQESKLHERPTEEVWQKLQSKLEKSRRTRRRKRRSIRFLQLGVVALILLLLIFAAVMVWHFTRK